MTSSPEGAAPRHHVPALDGLRGVAIVLVAWFHTSYRCHADYVGVVAHVYERAAMLGRTGVDLFFALSGFLITGILLATRGRRGWLRSFYARRALRTLPLHYAVLLTTFVILAPCLSTFDWYAAMRSRQAWYWCLSFNWWVAREGSFPAFDFLNPLWSLDVEEQFYLAWAIVVACFRPLGVLAACAVALIASVSLRGWGAHHGWSHGALYAGTFARLDALVLGSALAAARAHGVSPAVLLRWSGRVALIAAAALLARRTTDVDDSAVGQLAVACVFAWSVLLAAESRADALVARALSTAPARWLGTRSYGLYLLQQPVVLMLSAHWPLGTRLPPIANHLVFLSVSSLAAAALAEASWRWFERPILVLKRRFVVGDAAPRPAAASIASPA